MHFEIMQLIIWQFQIHIDFFCFISYSKSVFFFSPCLFLTSSYFTLVNLKITKYFIQHQIYEHQLFSNFLFLPNAFKFVNPHMSIRYNNETSFLFYSIPFPFKYLLMCASNVFFLYACHKRFDDALLNPVEKCICYKCIRSIFIYISFEQLLFCICVLIG